MAATVLSMARESHGCGTERELAWEMRFARLLLYEHAALRCLGAWTVGPAVPEKKIDAADFELLLTGDTAAGS